ncbi:NADH-quinone oxidoreductase subunit C [Paenibacillus thermotolerans]|uniref:NADH-quinone oxidoreductase subunit C n=1 Tax=Paenibacillus thermotolerans TaxID=3027807 RepID=UPI00236853F4|nr:MULTISPECIES: NADH-quinone oxidoreductase subunit C [unclassified Paenibacillus]
MSDNELKKDPQNPNNGANDGNGAEQSNNPESGKPQDTPVEQAAEALAKESGGNPPEQMPEGYDVSVPVNEKEVADFTPAPEKDASAMQNAPDDKVKVKDGKATPTEETVAKTLEKQQPGGETAEAVAKERQRDAEAAAEGKKEHAETSAADMQGETAPEPSAEAPAAAAPPADTPKAPKAPLSEAEKEERIKRALEAKAAREAAKAAEGGGEAKPAGEAGDAAAAAAPKAPRAPRAAKAEAAEDAAPKEPSPKQPLLDRWAAIIREAVHEGAVEAAVINEKNGHMPTLTISNEHWSKTAETIKNHPEFSMNYLRNVSGVDQETHLEVVYHYINMADKNELCVKVKTDRENASVASVTPLYATANWTEREVFDLLGIDFPGHPDLRRIMMPDDWEGYPLRKDYEPLDPEV